MKNAFAFILCMIIGRTCIAQCTFNSAIFKTTNTCIDTLFAHSSGNISKITWLYENAVDTIVLADSGFSKNAVTVAGGNGQGWLCRMPFPRTVTAKTTFFAFPQPLLRKLKTLAFTTAGDRWYLKPQIAALAGTELSMEASSLKVLMSG